MPGRCGGLPQPKTRVLLDSSTASGRAIWLCEYFGYFGLAVIMAVRISDLVVVRWGLCLSTLGVRAEPANVDTGNQRGV